MQVNVSAATVFNIITPIMNSGLNGAVNTIHQITKLGKVVSNAIKLP
jgi:hypothetical protein